jgi:hypothetical protein
MRIVGPIVVALLAALMLGTTLPDVVRVFGHPVYEFGYRIGDTGFVTGVEAGLPAAKADIRQGDRLDILNTPRDGLSAAYLGGTVVRHERVAMGFTRDGIRRPRPDLPRGDKEPVLAIPVLVRDRLIAIALYGSHINREALDPDEGASIDRLAGGAAAAYDHLEAEALRREIELLRALAVGSQKNTI